MILLKTREKGEREETSVERYLDWWQPAEWLDRVHELLPWWWSLPAWQAFLILLAAVMGGIYIYHLMMNFTAGLALWPRTPEEHSLHTVEGFLWPITLTVAILYCLCARLLGVVRYIVDHSGHRAFLLGRRMSGVERRAPSAEVARHLDQVQADAARVAAPPSNQH